MKRQFNRSIQYLKGVGPAKASNLAKLGILTINDLLEHYPKRYEDRSLYKKIAELVDGSIETLSGSVTCIQDTKPRRGLTITKVTINDETGIANLVWFNQPFVKKKLAVGLKLIVSGKIKRQFNKIEISNPEFEILENNDDFINTGRIVPIYPSNESISQNLLKGLIRQVLSEEELWRGETLPPEFIGEFGLVSRELAIPNIHFPDCYPALIDARRRLVFEELFIIQCGLAFLKAKNKKTGGSIKHSADGFLLKKMKNILPFKLTEDQINAWQEIRADMEDLTSMQRLLQGDVGSGKTIIAVLALLKTVENGYQGAMMAPTEILAEQHYDTLKQLLSPLELKIGILNGSMNRSAKEKVLSEIRDGVIDITIGTHAIIQDSVVFKNLGIVITDEQHRFGVKQRAKLLEKGKSPDVLVMTATPIPRTMALTVYGDLDVSIIRQMPPGRKPIRTFLRTNDSRQKVYEFLIKEVEKGRQAYIVCPLIDESEKINSQSAVELFELLTSTVFKNIRCGLVHGKIKVQDKDEIMSSFYSGDIKILIATTVIEVGVNVPNATVMVVEGADRFGLAQLHQLRGRIGRGEHQSYCILLTENKSNETKQRLELMETTTDGFALAEEDLKLRGPGQLFGNRQHGLPDLKIADIVNDIDILLLAKKAAQKTVNNSIYNSYVEQLINTHFPAEFTEILRN
ncbi:ATP-dependent DNA helicase RecG [Dendrosporobacter sp. 1207_IL3150]|uniref:ATP-dependent DNA helicase RecG n=1 Tax=Dendrosporobacter sp. 1207_IL3150 TaxID=3084054 RepID=UPI002FDB1CB3